MLDANTASLPTFSTQHDIKRANDIISELMNALDLIVRRDGVSPNGNIAYCRGVAAEAMRRCDAQRVRNSDGYLVVAVGESR